MISFTSIISVITKIDTRINSLYLYLRPYSLSFSNISNYLLNFFLEVSQIPQTQSVKLNSSPYPSSPLKEKPYSFLLPPSGDSSTIYPRPLSMLHFSSKYQWITKSCIYNLLSILRFYSSITALIQAQKSHTQTLTNCIRRTLEILHKSILNNYHSANLTN